MDGLTILPLRLDGVVLDGCQTHAFRVNFGNDAAIELVIEPNGVHHHIGLLEGDPASLDSSSGMLLQRWYTEVSFSIPMNTGHALIAIANVAAMCLGYSALRAQEATRSVWDGVYSAEQAKRGLPL